MKEDIKNDLSSIAFSHPFFRDIVGNTLNYIEKLEQENNNFKEASIINDSLYKEVCNKNKELEEENKRLVIEKATALQEVRKYKEMVKDRIPKSLIKEKIEELNKMLKKSHKKTQRLTVGEIMMIKTVLQELLGDEK